MTIPLSSDPLIDFDYLKSLVGSDEIKGNELLVDIGGTFQEEIVKMRDAILDAIQRKDAETLQKQTHKLSGGASSVGLRRLAGYAKNVENTIRAGESIDFEEVKGVIEPLIEDTCAAFSELMG